MTAYQQHVLSIIGSVILMFIGLFVVIIMLDLAWILNLKLIKLLEETIK